MKFIEMMEENQKRYNDIIEKLQEQEKYRDDLELLIYAQQVHVYLECLINVNIFQNEDVGNQKIFELLEQEGYINKVDICFDKMLTHLENKIIEEEER